MKPFCEGFYTHPQLHHVPSYIYCPHDVTRGMRVGGGACFLSCDCSTVSNCTKLQALAGPKALIRLIINQKFFQAHPHASASQ